MVLMVLLIACAPASRPAQSTTSVPAPQPTQNRSLQIEADYLVEAAFGKSGINDRCMRETGVTVAIKYVNSNTVRNDQANKDSLPYHAYWATSPNYLPASSSVLYYTAKSYGVVGAQASKAKVFGWTGNSISAKSFFTLVGNKTVKPGMTNPAQADPSASLLNNLGAFLANENMLTMDGVNKLDQNLLKTYFGQISNVSDNADELSKAIIADLRDKTNKFNAYMLPEAQLIQINQELERLRIEPIQAFYITDATVGLKFPLGYVKGNDSRDAFEAFAKCVSKSPESMKTLESRGYRTAEYGFSMENADPKVFRKEWGIDASMADLPLRDNPTSAVAIKLGNLYQTIFKKPLNAVMVADVSGSMNESRGNGSDGKPLPTGKQGLDMGTTLIFNQEEAEKLTLGIGPIDIYSVYLFGGNGCTYLGTVTGNNKPVVTQMALRISSYQASGGTPIYSCIASAIDRQLSGKYELVGVGGEKSAFESPFDPTLFNYNVYAMTDGARTDSWEYDKAEDKQYNPNKILFIDYYKQEKTKVKINGVGFGKVDMSETGEFSRMVKLGKGVLKDGRTDLKNTLIALFSNQ